MRRRSQIMDSDLGQARFLRPPNDAVIERAAEKIGKDRQNIDLDAPRANPGTVCVVVRHNLLP
jgi:hypothetical protein